MHDRPEQHPSVHEASATTLVGSDADGLCATGGASNCLRPSYGGSQAPAQGGGGAPARAPELGVVAAEGSRDQEKPPPAVTPPAVAVVQCEPRVVRASAAAAARRKPKRRQRDAAQLKKPVSVRLSPDERQLLQKHADEAGLTLAHLIARRATADQTAAVAADAQVEQLDAAIDELAASRSALAPIGNNLNQIARQRNTDGTIPTGLAKEFLDRAPALLAQVRTDVEHLDEVVFRIARRRGRA